MVEFDEQLRCLVAQVCGHPPGSPQRQKLLTQIIRLSTSRLWRENTAYYQDALQQTWLYFCRNICEGKTAQAYDPTYGTVVTWLNAYLKRRLQDFYINHQKEQAIIAPIRIPQGSNNEVINPVDNLPATPPTPHILEHLENWVITDSDGDLRATCIKGHPNINCQVLILKRLPPEVSWRELSQELGLSISTLSSFYQRQCLPRLRAFAEDEGYL